MTTVSEIMHLREVTEKMLNLIDKGTVQDIDSNASKQIALNFHKLLEGNIDNMRVAYDIAINSYDVRFNEMLKKYEG